MAGRDSNLELLRIISMFLIVLAHAGIHGVGGDSCGGLFRFAGPVGVDCFVMIGGFYMVNKKITLRRMLRLWVLLFTWSSLLYVLLCCVNPSPKLLAPVSIKCAFLPFVSNTYWFVTTYILLMLLSPFLNHYLRSLSRDGAVRFMLVASASLVILPSIFHATNCAGALGFFAVLYSLAGCIRLHVDFTKVRPGGWLMVALAILTVVEVAQMLSIQSAGTSFSGLMGVVAKLVCSRAVYMAMAACLLVGCAACRMGTVRWINIAASCTFAIYLIHDNPFVRPVLWKGLLHAEAWADSPWALLFCAGAAVLVYVACSLVELVRQQTLGRLYDWCEPRFILPLLERVWGKVRRLAERSAGVS